MCGLYAINIDINININFMINLILLNLPIFYDNHFQLITQILFHLFYFFKN